MKGFFVGLSKLIIGVAIALVLLSMAGVATARYFMARLSVLPPKPLFEGEQPVPTAPEIVPAEGAPAAVQPPPAEITETTPPPESPASEGYSAEVIQPIGLVLREGPGTNYPQVGGVDYEEEVMVLEEPSDQPWIKVRVVVNGQEGWVKAGNTRRVEN